MTADPTPERTPPTGTCARCGQHRPLFTPRPEWGLVPSPLCTVDWQKYAEARADGGFVDYNDAFENADDEEFDGVLDA